MPAEAKLITLAQYSPVAVQPPTTWLQVPLLPQVADGEPVKPWSHVALQAVPAGVELPQLKTPCVRFGGLAGHAVWWQQAEQQHPN